MTLPDEIESDNFKSVYDECKRLKNQLDKIQEAIERGDGKSVDRKTQELDKKAGQLRMTTVRQAQRCE